jgi:hypothetical protein
MRAPNYPAGQGARRQCLGCGQPLTIRLTGRPRKFCSDRCRDEARRHPTILPQNSISEGGRYHPSGRPQNPDFLSTKSTQKTAISADRASPVFAIGLGVSSPPRPTPDGQRAELIRRAVEVEMRVRWPRLGLKWGRGRS